MSLPHREYAAELAAEITDEVNSDAVQEFLNVKGVDYDHTDVAEIEHRIEEMAKLPTPDEIIAKADAELRAVYRALGGTADLLRSRWAPGTPPTPQQTDTFRRMLTAIAGAKDAINEGRP